MQEVSSPAGNLARDFLMANETAINPERRNRKPTAADVARKAGVSPATVSYVIRGRRDIQLSEATRERVLAVAQTLGYTTDPIASALRTGRTGQIAVWVDNLLTSYNARVLHYMEAQGGQAAYQIVVSLLRHAPPEAAAALAALPADGIIAHDQVPRVRGLLRANPNRRLPIVITGVDANDIAEVSSVTIDLSPGATEAAEHLVRHGRRRIAYLIPESLLAGDLCRVPAYRAVLERAGLTPEFIPARGPVDERLTYREAVRQYVRERGLPDGLLCFNDDIAIGAYRGLCDLGIRIPDDVAVVGCDGIEETEYGFCPLSTIVLPIEQMCAEAWELLARRLQDPDAPAEHRTLQAHLAVRQSSGTPADARA